MRQIPPGKTFHLEGLDLICDEAVDREKTDRYRIVVARAQGQESKVIFVHVDDENDNSPDCFGIKAVLVRSDPQFVPWNCIDEDANLNGTIGFKVIKDTEAVLEVNSDGFKVAPLTGDPQHFSVLVYDRSTELG